MRRRQKDTNRNITAENSVVHLERVDNLICSLLRSSIRKNFPKCCRKTKMTHSVLQVYKRFHGNFYWVISKLSKRNSRNISNDPSTIVNIWKHSKTKFATKNYSFLQFLPVKLKSNALQATSISKWNMLWLRIALSTFRSHETCKVAIQHLKKFLKISKIFCQYKTLLFVWFQVVCTSKPVGF